MIRRLKENKKGQMGIIFYFIILFMILIIAFIVSIGVGIIDYTSDTITPIFTDLGVIDGVNASQIGQYTFGNLNTFVQALPWLVGLAYVGALVLSIVFVVIYENNPHPAYAGLFFVWMVLLIFFSIIMSNMYQDIYSGDDEIGSRLREQALLSYMILYSPAIMTIFATFGALYLFIGNRTNQGGYP